MFLEGWLKSQSKAPADGLADMRRGVELLREQNFLLFDGLVKLALVKPKPAQAILGVRFPHPGCAPSRFP